MTNSHAKQIETFIAGIQSDYLDDNPLYAMLSAGELTLSISTESNGEGIAIWFVQLKTEDGLEIGGGDSGRSLAQAVWMAFEDLVRNASSSATVGKK